MWKGWNFYSMPSCRAYIQYTSIQVPHSSREKKSFFEPQMHYPTESWIAVCKAEMEAWRWRRPASHQSDGETAANYSWHFFGWHFSTASPLNGISPPRPTAIYPPPHPNTHINSPFYSCHNSTPEIAASSVHLIDPFEQVLDLIQSQSIFFKHFIL